MNPYEELNVPTDATPDEIKKAYRRKAMKAHPDHGGSDSAFALLNEANRILSDPDERAYYDRTGEPKKTQRESMDEATQLCCRMFAECVSKYQHRITKVNVVEVIKLEITRKGQRDFDSVKNGERALKLAEDVLSRFKRKGDGLPFIESVLQSDITACHKAIAEAKRQQEINKDAILLMENYEFQYDEDAPRGSRADTVYQSIRTSGFFDDWNIGE